jgi:hypothetical protein
MSSISLLRTMPSPGASGSCSRASSALSSGSSAVSSPARLGSSRGRSFTGTNVALPAAEPSNPRPPRAGLEGALLPQLGRQFSAIADSRAIRMPQRSGHRTDDRLGVPSNVPSTRRNSVGSAGLGADAKARDQGVMETTARHEDLSALSQGGDTGSNPVGGATRNLLRNLGATPRLLSLEGHPIPYPHRAPSSASGSAGATPPGRPP